MKQLQGSMDAEQNKQLDKFIKKAVSEAGLEEPSSGFTESIMQDIAQTEISTIKPSNKPLINKYIWLVIGIVVIAACSVSLLGDWETNIPVPFINNLPELDLISSLNNLDTSLIDNINIHNNVVYAVLMLSVFFYIQMLLLERKVQL